MTEQQNHHIISTTVGTVLHLMWHCKGAVRTVKGTMTNIINKWDSATKYKTYFLIEIYLTGSLHGQYSLCSGNLVLSLETYRCPVISC